MADRPSTSRIFKINRDYNDIGCNIHKKRFIEIKSGLTVFIGCNGIGKTTLMHQLQDMLRQDKIPVLSFDNLKDGGSRARDHAGFYGDMGFLIQSITSSEGENICLNIGNFAGKIGSFIHCHPDAEELWIFMDAIDSGLSIDNVLEIKGLCRMIFDTNPNKKIYIIISANAFEFARDEECFDIYRCKYRKFKSYDAYRNFVLKTREAKDKRVYKTR